MKAKLKMQHRRLGRTGFMASVIGFGGIPIGEVSKEEAVAAVRRAIEMGVNFFDTARAYGDSEDKIGEAIRGKRDRFFIATKSHKRTKSQVTASIDDSLNRLGIEVIDLMQIHGVDTENDLEKCLTPGGVLETMKQSQKEGKVRFVGISGHQPSVLVKALETNHFDAVLVPYNLTNGYAAKELFPLARKLDVGVMVMKPLGGGSLAIPPQAVEFRVAHRAIATAEAALRFVLSNADVATTVPGMRNIGEVEQDVPLGYDFEPMSSEEAQQLQERARQIGYTFCQGCGYCLPLCSQCIDIRDVFKLWVFTEQYGMGVFAKRYYQEYHRDKARTCTGCGDCMDRCPSQLDIPTLLRKADSILA